jgi:hypothetical protein
LNEHNTIIIHNTSREVIKQTLNDWLLTNADSIVGLKFMLYNSGNALVIKADEKLDNELFCFLVNYLTFPIDVELKGKIFGYARFSNFNKISDSDVMVYIPENEIEYDNVYLVTSKNENYKYDFGGKTTPAGFPKFYIPVITGELTNPETFSLDEETYKEAQKKESKKNVALRFKIIVGLIIISFIVCFFLLMINNNYYPKISILGFAVWMWMVADNKILESDKNYLILFALAILIMYYGNYINIHFNPAFDANYSRYPLAFILPVSTLVFQWPFRRIFKFIMKRDPSNKTNKEFADTVYFVLLGSCSILFPIGYFDL